MRLTLTSLISVTAVLAGPRHSEVKHSESNTSKCISSTNQTCTKFTQTTNVPLSIKEKCEKPGHTFRQKALCRKKLRMSPNRHLRIFGGTDIKTGERPFMVKLHINEEMCWSPGNCQISASQCGASLIHKNWVLTAAHCIPKELKDIDLHFHNGGKGGGFCVETVSNSRDVIVSDEYDENVVMNDIALLKIDHTNGCVKKLRNSRIPNVRANWRINLSSAIISNNEGSVKNLAKQQHQPQLKLQVAGWGMTEHGVLSKTLKYVNLPVHSTKVCNQKTGSDYPECKKGNHGCWTTETVQFCAGPTVTEKDSCVGDSGGPMFSIKDDKYYQHGIVSYGPENCGQSAPGVYTQVASYIGWIQKQIRKNGQTPPKITRIVGTTDEIQLEFKDIFDKMEVQYNETVECLDSDQFAVKCEKNGKFTKTKLSDLERGDSVLSAFEKCTKVVIINRHAKLNDRKGSNKNFIQIITDQDSVNLTPDHNGLIIKNGEHIEIPAFNLKSGDNLIKNSINRIKLNQLGGDYISVFTSNGTILVNNIGVSSFTFGNVEAQKFLIKAVDFAISRQEAELGQAIPDADLEVILSYSSGLIVSNHAIAEAFGHPGNDLDLGDQVVLGGRLISEFISLKIMKTLDVQDSQVNI